MATAVPLRDLVETFTLNFNNLRSNAADLELTWENTKVIIPITVDTDGKVMSTIKSIMDGPAATDYYAAARYYFEEKKDMAMALAWVDKSLEKGGDRLYSATQSKYFQPATAVQRCHCSCRKKAQNWPSRREMPITRE